MSTVVEGLDWTWMTEDLNALGCALTSPILTPEQCVEFVSMFEHDELFRSTIDIARYRFGNGPMQVVVGLNAPDVDHTGGSS